MFLPDLTVDDLHHAELAVVPGAGVVVAQLALGEQESAAVVIVEAGEAQIDLAVDEEEPRAVVLNQLGDFLHLTIGVEVEGGSMRFGFRGACEL